MVRVEVISRGARPPMGYARAVAVVRFALSRAGITDAEVSVVFVSDAVMRRLNRSYRKRDAVTDVLSFGSVRTRADRFPEETPVGEIVIAPREAARRAKKSGISFKDEILLLLVHGSLHLAGYDHERPKDAAVMLPLQEKIIRIYLKNNFESVSRQF